jgi:hypothetical protein
MSDTAILSIRESADSPPVALSIPFNQQRAQGLGATLEAHRDPPQPQPWHCAITPRMPRRAVLPLHILIAVVMVACGSESPGAPTPTVSVQGVWSGTWNRQACSETGAAVGVGCNALPTSGGLRITLTQSTTAVQGALEIGIVQVSVSGTIATAGALTLAGSGRLQAATVNVSDWSTVAAGTVMTGAFSYIVVSDDASVGTVTVRAELRGVTKMP